MNNRLIMIVMGTAMGCSKAPAPEPAPAPVPAPAASVLLAPRAVVGTYRLRTDIARPASGGGNRGGGGGGRQRGQNPNGTPLRLDATPQAAEGVATAYRARVVIPGYTNAGSDRSAWWPIPGDSVVIQFTGQRGNRVQLRGALQAGALQGEIWLTSAETGSTYQLGTFTAARERR